MIHHTQLLDKVDTALDAILTNIVANGAYETVLDTGPGGSYRTHQIYHTIGLSDLRALRKDLIQMIGEVIPDDDVELDINELYQSQPPTGAE